MRVEFTRHEKAGRYTCSWTAHVGKRTQVPGPVMPEGAHLPHDLAQYVAEATTRTERGFWGLIAAGATFKSTGRKVTKPGRAVILGHRDDLDAAEAAANTAIHAWRAGDLGEAGAPFDAALAQWRGLGSGDHLVFEWPNAEGTIVRHDYDAGSRTTGV